MSEPEFLVEAAKRSGCGILLDINNIYVCASNHRFDPMAYIDQIPAELVGEIHLAGHETLHLSDGSELCIDDHGSAVCQDVWHLHETALAKLGMKPMLIEWDTDVPPLKTLLDEAGKADRIAVKVQESTRRVASA